MTSSRRRPVQARSVAALVLWAGVPALALLSIAACAAIVLLPKGIAV